MSPDAQSILRLYKAFPGIRRTTTQEQAIQRGRAHLVQRDKTQIHKAANAAGSNLKLWSE